MTQASVIRLASTLGLAAITTGLLAAAPVDGRGTPATGNPPVIGADSAPSIGKSVSRYRKPVSTDIVLPVDPRTQAPLWTGGLVVKFRDDLKVRADRGPVQFAATADGRALPEIESTLKTVGGTIRQAINRPVSDLEQLQARAFARSGKVQPDLASMMYVDVSPGQLLETARAFNDMDIVEWVELDRVVALEGGGQNQSPQYGCGQNGVGDDSGSTNCYTTAVPAGPPARCSEIAGGPGCNNVGGCLSEPVGPDCAYGCNNIPCCELVSDILPGCEDANDPRGWDALCATYANIYCNGNVYSGSPPIAGGQTANNALYRYDPASRCVARLTSRKSPFPFRERSWRCPVCPPCSRSS